MNKINPLDAQHQKKTNHIKEGMQESSAGSGTAYLQNGYMGVAVLQIRQNRTVVARYASVIGEGGTGQENTHALTIAKTIGAVQNEVRTGHSSAKILWKFHEFIFIIIIECGLP